MKSTIVYTTEKHRIKPSHKIYQLLDQLCFKSKNLYNLGLYTQRQIYFQHNKFLSPSNLIEYLKNTETFKDLPCSLSQQTLRKLCQTLSGFQKASKDFQNNPSKYLGRPKIPKYLHKVKGRYTIILNSQACRIHDNQIHFHKILQGFTLKTKLLDIQQVQITKRNRDYYIIATGTKTISTQSNADLKYLAGLDLGIDNFSTISIWTTTSRPLIIDGKDLKSYNKYFNKKLAHLKSELDVHNKNKPKNQKQYTSKRIENLWAKRNMYMDTFTHQASKRIVDYLLQNKVSQLVIGYNQDWKQNSKLSKRVNQTFIQIPYLEFINKITYKANQAGITVILTEESYTSGTSFLDNETPTLQYYNKSRRLHRGLFRSNTNIQINSDVNAAYQITKKVYSDLTISEQILKNDTFLKNLTPIKIKPTQQLA